MQHKELKQMRSRPVNGRQAVAMALMVVASLFARWGIATMNAHSGYQAPPMHGDFEAQRHWIELTSHLPLASWYTNQPPQNNLTYWGLDYPPLTAYHSMLLGQFGWMRLSQGQFNASLGLVVSHGSESPATIRFMRETVVWSDMLVFFPAAIAVAFLFSVELDPMQWVPRRGAGPSEGRSGDGVAQPVPHRRRSTLLVSLMVLLNASLPLILIDHGHFQYNCVSLGLMLWSIYHAARHVALYERLRVLVPLDTTSSSVRRLPPTIAALYHLIASVACAALSMSFKQMSLYYAPGLAAWYLGECLRYALWRSRSLAAADSNHASFHGSPKLQRKHRAAAKHAGTVAGSLFVAVAVCAVAGFGTFAVVFSPFYWTGTLSDVVSRIFPVGRGLYEDKVANVWCSISPLIKLPQVVEFVVGKIASQDTTASLLSERTRQGTLVVCLATTIAGCAPACWAVLAAAWRGEGRDDYVATTSKQVEGTDLWRATQHAAVRAQQRVEQLLWLMVASSLSFYLFAYQVHEKGVLLPLLPATVLLALLYRRRDSIGSAPALFGGHPDALRLVLWEQEEKCGVLWLFVLVAHTSLFQLAGKDRIVATFFAMFLILLLQVYRSCALGPPPAAVHQPPVRAWCNAGRVYRWFLVAATVEECVRMAVFEGSARYPHLGILSRFALCAAVFLWVLMRSNACALRR